MRLIVFDLDGTLAKLGKGICLADLALLKKLSRTNNIAICSGKPTYYLCGFMRQVGIKNPILIGENGATIMFGVDLPPQKRYRIPYPDEANANIKKLKELILDAFEGKLWYQPNEVCFTPFPKSKEEFEIIENIVRNNKVLLNAVEYYRHIDSFDFVPKGVNKYAGLNYLCQILDIPRNKVIAVGDGVNDYPMFEFAGYSVGINIKEKAIVDINFSSVNLALKHLVTI